MSNQNHNRNGQLVLQAINNLEKPSTVTEISKLIAETVGASVSDVKDSVQKTLDGGVQLGYVQRLRNKFFSAPLELTEGVNESDSIVSDSGKNNKISKELEAPARRRRKSPRARRAGRTVSRRRRSRRSRSSHS